MELCRSKFLLFPWSSGVFCTHIGIFMVECHQLWFMAKLSVIFVWHCLLLFWYAHSNWVATSAYHDVKMCCWEAVNYNDNQNTYYVCPSMRFKVAYVGISGVIRMNARLFSSEFFESDERYRKLINNLAFDTHRLVYVYCVNTSSQFPCVRVWMKEYTNGLKLMIIQCLTLILQGHT